MSIFGSSDRVDVRTIFSTREDTVYVPREHDVFSSPLSSSGVRSTMFVLLTIRHGPEQEFVITRVSTEVSTVRTPIESGDERVMSIASRNLLVSSVNIVNVDHIVVRTYGQVLSTRRDAHALNPFLGIGKDLIRAPADMYFTIVSGDNWNAIMNDNTTRALRVREIR